jgi:TniQ
LDDLSRRISEKSLFCDVLPLHPQPLPLEAFTSYISRLSEANGLKTAEEIAHLLFSGTSMSSYTVRQLADFPLTSLGTLPVLGVCSQSDLLKTTFFHLGRKFGRNPQNMHRSGFLSDSVALDLRYCPHCLMNQSVPYYSLLWRFLHLYNCPAHDSPLLNHCTHCGSRIPLFAIPPKIPFCTSCNKDLRQCQPSEVNMTSERRVVLSLKELEFLLLPQECELEEDIPLLLRERLAYQGRLKSMRIVHGYQGFTPHKINREVPDDEKVKIKKRQVDVRKIRSHNAVFVNYLNYIRFLGITFNDLFTREFFTTRPSDPDEQAKQAFLLLERSWKL